MRVEKGGGPAYSASRGGEGKGKQEKGRPGVPCHGGGKSKGDPPNMWKNSRKGEKARNTWEENV